MPKKDPSDGSPSDPPKPAGEHVESTERLGIDDPFSTGLGSGGSKSSSGSGTLTARDRTTDAHRAILAANLAQKEEEDRRNKIVKALGEWDDDAPPDSSDPVDEVLDLKTPEGAAKAARRDDAGPAKMAEYAASVSEITFPDGETAFRTPTDAGKTLDKAFPILREEAWQKDRAKLVLALMGVVRHVPIELFEKIIERVRTAQAETRVSPFNEQLAGILARVHAEQAEKPTAERNEDPLTSMQPFARVIHDVSAPSTSPIPSVMEMPSKKAGSPITLIVAALVLLALIVTISVGYLYQGQSSIKSEVIKTNAEVERLDWRITDVDGKYAEKFNSLLARVGEKDTKIVDLTNQRDQYATLARELPKEMNRISNQDARARNELRAQFNTLQTKLQATDQEIARLRQELAASKKEPPTP